MILQGELGDEALLEEACHFEVLKDLYHFTSVLSTSCVWIKM